MGTYEQDHARLTKKANALEAKRATVDYSTLRDVKVKIPLYHGTRQKLSAEEIKEKGIVTYKSGSQAEKEVLKALKYFGKENYARFPNKGAIVQSILNEARATRRPFFSCTPWEEATSSWSSRAPELVCLALDGAGVSKKDTKKYLDETYGKRYKLKVNLKGSPTLASINHNYNDIHTGRKIITSKEILEVSTFPEDDWIKKWPEGQWISSKTVSSEDKKMLKHIQKTYTYGGEKETIGIQLSQRGRVLWFKIL